MKWISESGVDSTDGSLTQDFQLSFIQRNIMDKLQAGHSNWIAWNRIETKGMLTSNVLETAALTR